MLAACKKEQTPVAPAPPMPQLQATLPPGFKELARDAKSEEARDRRLMILPAPAGFKPESQEPKLRLTIQAESPRIKVRAPLRLRLVVQNVGGATYSLTKRASLLKAKGVIDAAWAFYAVQGKSGRMRLKSPLGGEDGEGEFMSAAEAERRGRAAAAFVVLHAKLAPGESIVSLPRTVSTPDDWTPGPSDNFVEVADKYAFPEPTLLRISAEFTCARFDPVRMEILPDETVVSNAVDVEVAP